MGERLASQPCDLEGGRVVKITVFATDRRGDPRLGEVNCGDALPRKTDRSRFFSILPSEPYSI